MEQRPLESEPGHSRVQGASADRVKYPRNGSRRRKRRPEHGTTKRCLSLSISLGSYFTHAARACGFGADAFSRSSSRFIDTAESLLIFIDARVCRTRRLNRYRVPTRLLWQQGDRPHSISSGRVSLPGARPSKPLRRDYAWWVRLLPLPPYYTLPSVTKYHQTSITLVFGYF